MRCAFLALSLRFLWAPFIASLLSGRADIIASKQAIEYYKEHNIKDIKNIAAYHLEQAAEKLIKFQIYELADEVNSARIYTHDIGKLLAYADSLEYL